MLTEDLSQLVPVLHGAPLDRYPGRTTPVLRLSGNVPSGTTFSFLALPPSGIESVGGWRKDFAAKPLGSLAAAVTPERDDSLRSTALPRGRWFTMPVTAKGDAIRVRAIFRSKLDDYVLPIGKANIRAHEHEVVTYAHQRLREINSLKIFGTARDKGAIVAFELKGAHPHDVATIIDRSGVAVRAGTHCTMPLLARFGVTATCRASFALYNTRAEVDSLAQALTKAQDFFA